MAWRARAAVGVRLIAEEQAALRRVAVRVAQGESPEEIFAAVAAEAGQVLHAEQAYDRPVRPRRHAERGRRVDQRRRCGRAGRHPVQHLAGGT